MGSKIPWDDKELKELVANPKSRIEVVQSRLPVVLEPFHLQDPKSAVRGILEATVDSYDKSLNGIVLSYKHLKILSSCGSVAAETSGVVLDVQADFYLFRPKVGCVLTGVVNKTSRDHVGVLLYKRFNVSCPRPSNCSEAGSWLGSSVHMNQEVTFKLREINFTGRLPYFRGELHSCGIVLNPTAVEEVQGSPKKKKKKMKECDIENEAIEESQHRSRKRPAGDHTEEQLEKPKKSKKDPQVSLNTSISDSVVSPKEKKKKKKDKSLDRDASQLLPELSTKKGRSMGMDEVDFIPKMSMDESLFATSQLDNLPPPNADSTHFDLGKSRLSLDSHAGKKSKDKSNALSAIKEESSLGNKGNSHASLVANQNQSTDPNKTEHKKKKKSKKNEDSLSLPNTKSEDGRLMTEIASVAMDISPSKKKQKKGDIDVGGNMSSVVPNPTEEKLMETSSKKKKIKDSESSKTSTTSEHSEEQLMEELLKKVVKKMKKNSEHSKTSTINPKPAEEQLMEELLKKMKKKKKDSEHSKASTSNSIPTEELLTEPPSKKKKNREQSQTSTIIPKQSEQSTETKTKKKKVSKSSSTISVPPEEQIVESPSKKKKDSEVSKVGIDMTKEGSEEMPSRKKNKSKGEDGKPEVETIKPLHKKDKSKKLKTSTPLTQDVLASLVAGLDKVSDTPVPEKKTKAKKTSNTNIPSSSTLASNSEGILNTNKVKKEKEIKRRLNESDDESDEIMPGGQKSIHIPSPPRGSPVLSYMTPNKIFNRDGVSLNRPMPLMYGTYQGVVPPPPESPVKKSGPIDKKPESSSGSDSGVPDTPKKVTITNSSATSSDSDAGGPSSPAKPQISPSKKHSSLSLSGNRKPSASDSDSESDTKPVFNKFLQSMGVMQSPLKAVQPAPKGRNSSSESDSDDGVFVKSMLTTSKKAPKATPPKQAMDDSDTDSGIKAALAKLPLLAAKSLPSPGPMALEKSSGVAKTPTKPAVQKASKTPKKTPVKSVAENQLVTPEKTSKSALKTHSNTSSAVKESYSKQIALNDTDSDSDMEVMKSAWKKMSETAPKKSPSKAVRNVRKETKDKPTRTPRKSKGSLSNDASTLEAAQLTTIVSKPASDSDSDIFRSKSPPIKNITNHNITYDSDSGPDDRNTTAIIEKHRKEQKEKVSALKTSVKKPRGKAAPATNKDAGKATTKKGTRSKKSEESPSETTMDSKKSDKTSKVEKKSKSKESSTDNAISDVMQRLLQQANLKMGLA